MLYHYTSFDSLKGICRAPSTDEGLCFWASRFDCFGDKEEYKLGISVIKQLLPELEKRLQPDRRIASSFEWEGIMSNETLPFPYVVSFTDKKDNEYMWDHYAYHGKGVVIAIDDSRRILTEHTKKYYFKKCLYLGDKSDAELFKEIEDEYFNAAFAALSGPQKELAQMHEEQKMLRVLASSGLMLASFSHDLSKLNITLDTRYQKIERLFESKVNRSEFDGVEDRKNPFYLLQDAKKTDSKIQSWLNFATGVIKKDKRKRNKLFLSDYFNRLDETWSSFFNSRAIAFDYENEENVAMRVFEVDMDSIFHNLFSNSIEAFNLMREDRPRTIHVSVMTTDKNIIIEYRDSGAGLSPDIHNPNDIFKPFFTTRRNPSTGEEIGTGLGMWIVKSVLVENDAEAVILNYDDGFGIRLSFPIKYSR